MGLAVLFATIAMMLLDSWILPFYLPGQHRYGYPLQPRKNFMLEKFLTLPRLFSFYGTATQRKNGNFNGDKKRAAMACHGKGSFTKSDGCVTVLPSLILVLDRPIEKTMHRSLLRKMDGLSRFITKRWGFSGDLSGHCRPGALWLASNTKCTMTSANLYLRIWII